MKILYITNKPIYPKVDGGCVAMANFLENLTFQNCKIHHIAIATQKHPFEQSNYPIELQKKIDISSVEIDTKVKPLNTLKSFLKNSSYHIDRFYSSELLQKISSTINENSFDCIIMDSLYSSAHLNDIKKVYSGKIFIRTHNVENEIWKDLAKNTKNPITKILLSKLAKNLEKYEIKSLKNVDGIMCISEEDLSTFEKMGISTKKTTISVSIPENKIKNDYNSNDLFHIGAMNWKPNEEAVNRLIDIFPKIESKTNIQLHLAGSHFPKHLRTSNSIKVHGFVENIFDFAIKSGILVTPITSSSGIRIKILEMMSIGIPIITTEKGAKGIHYKNKDCLVIANSNEEIITQSISLIKNKDRRMEIGKNSRSYIQENHCIEKISKQIIEFIQ